MDQLILTLRTTLEEKKKVVDNGEVVDKEELVILMVIKRRPHSMLALSFLFLFSNHSLAVRWGSTTQILLIFQEVLVDQAQASAQFDEKWKIMMIQ